MWKHFNWAEGSVMGPHVAGDSFGEGSHMSKPPSGEHELWRAPALYGAAAE